MRFAIVGDHPDGWAVARALAASGRHEIVAYYGAIPVEELNTEWPTLRRVADLEEVLADPAVEAVVVAGPPGGRLDQLRRVLQSERPALCVHPVDGKPDGAHEINLLQGDTHQVVLPILAVEPIRQVVRTTAGPLPVVELTVGRRGEVVFEADGAGGYASFPGWDTLRACGGEIVEVAAFAAAEEVVPGEPVLVHGRYASGGLFRALYLPRQDTPSMALRCIGPTGPVEADTAADPDRWSRLIARFELAVQRVKAAPRAVPGAGPAFNLADGLSWQDEIRALELDDSARRSVERRRAYTLDFQEVTEDVGFKGTMTLVGCALIWLIPVLLIVSGVFPLLGWVIVPVLFGFLGLQLLRWLVPAPRPADEAPPEEP